MKVNVRYFASIREALGPGEGVEVGDGATVGRVRDELMARDAVHAKVLARGLLLRSALNQVLCEESVVVTDGAEVAFFPPVTGG
jgi:sulfur-carrier protein